jgi:2,4-dienoyl-CoA reductase (NADPH2)
MNVLPKLGVRIHYRTTATAEKVLAEKPDVAIIAVGASPIIPKTPGVENGSKISTSGLRDWIWAKKF